MFGPGDEAEGFECISYADTEYGSLESPQTEPEPIIKKRRLILDQLRGFFALRKSKKDKKTIVTESTVDESLTLDSSVVSSYSADSENELEEEYPPIKTRLDESGVEVELGIHYSFIRDFVSKEVIGMYGDDDPTPDEQVAHVKTGLWQVIETSPEGVPQDPYYVVTAILMEDTVDTKKLRKAIFNGTNPRRHKVKMAPTEIAERLAGFQSGTMAPICHHEIMKLYMEETIVANGCKRVAVGSGAFGVCLSIDLEKFLEIAKKQSIQVQGIIKKRKPPALE